MGYTATTQLRYEYVIKTSVGGMIVTELIGMNVHRKELCKPTGHWEVSVILKV